MKQSILQMTTQAAGGKDEVTELIRKFEGSSLSLQNAFLESSFLLSNHKATEPIDPLSISATFSNIEQEESKHIEVDYEKI